METIIIHDEAFGPRLDVRERTKKPLSELQVMACFMIMFKLCIAQKYFF
jgi:hypothetical protein